LRRCGTAVTGYGNITPKSAGGRAFTLIYVMIGIPIQLVTLAAVGDWLSRAFDQCFFRPCHFEDSEYRSMWPLRKHFARMLVSFTVFLGFFAVIPAYIFQLLENWSFGEGIYYAVISLTTIGFGDYEAGLFCYCNRSTAVSIVFVVIVFSDGIGRDVLLKEVALIKKPKLTYRHAYTRQ